MRMHSACRGSFESHRRSSTLASTRTGMSVLVDRVAADLLIRKAWNRAGASTRDERIKRCLALFHRCPLGGDERLGLDSDCQWRTSWKIHRLIRHDHLSVEMCPNGHAGYCSRRP